MAKLIRNSKFKTHVVEHSERARDVLGEIGQHRNVHVAETSLLTRGLRPGEVREVRITRTRDNLKFDNSTTAIDKNLAEKGNKTGSGRIPLHPAI